MGAVVSYAIETEVYGRNGDDVKNEMITRHLLGMKQHGIVKRQLDPVSLHYDSWWIIPPGQKTSNETIHVTVTYVDKDSYSKRYPSSVYSEDTTYKIPSTMKPLSPNLIKSTKKITM